MEVVISRSSRAGKKYEARSNGKSVHFGATGYKDFTQHGDEQRRANYLSRHGNEDWTKKNLMTPAFMSRWLLWGEKSLTSAVASLNKKHSGVTFKLR